MTGRRYTGPLLRKSSFRRVANCRWSLANFLQPSWASGPDVRASTWEVRSPADRLAGSALPGDAKARASLGSPRNRSPGFPSASLFGSKATAKHKGPVRSISFFYLVLPLSFPPRIKLICAFSQTALYTKLGFSCNFQGKF